MVDFGKRLGRKATSRPIDPLKLYDSLDRSSEKGPLRPAQSAVLSEWHTNRRGDRDLIVKLHTGQGKTLIGLAMLQSKLNEDGGPALYLCPNNHLVAQTAEQAKEFGIGHCVAVAQDDIPDDFTGGKAILITTVQKLFNGLTKFGLDGKSLSVPAIVMDDAHACADAIRGQFTIRLSSEAPAYEELVDLFAEALQAQGSGTYVELREGSFGALLPVPYWEWQAQHERITEILSKHRELAEIKFAWPLLKDIMAECQCVVSGDGLEIAPYLPPLERFGSYYTAKTRIFMSATVTDDSFLVKGLRLSPGIIRAPLAYKDEKWSGEKMILIPSLIDDSLDRTTIVNTYGRPQAGRKYGVAVLVPSARMTADWKGCGALVADRSSIERDVERLKIGDRGQALVLVNRYDGIDLPDDSCRVLFFDSKPYAETLIDRYAEQCRPGSELTAMRTARTIEQGLGRSVRGEKDYCAIVVTGPELVKCLRTRGFQKYFSSQTKAQVELGLEIAEMAKEEIDRGTKPLDGLNRLINQCLKRDASWKEFYVERMDAVAARTAGGKALDIFEKELQAELAHLGGRHDDARKILQKLIDELIQDDSDKGWYLQEMARVVHPMSKVDSEQLQIAAHRKNRALLRAANGVVTERLVVSQGRCERIIAWLRDHGTPEEIRLHVDEVLADLRFPTAAEKFEQAFQDLGTALGFSCERPDKEWKEGPDNLWALEDDQYLLVECKSDADPKRAEIYKSETGQMNTACAWFAKKYKGAKSSKIMITPAGKLAKGAAFDKDVEVMRQPELQKLVKNARKFFIEFEGMNLKDLPEKTVQELLDAYGLSIRKLKEDYSKSIQ